jgi:general secretion pathway protein A
MTSSAPSPNARLEAKVRNFFGLKMLPFIKNSDPDHVFRTDSHNTALDRLHYLLDRRGIGAVFGNPGTGKSTLMRAFLNPLGKAHYSVCYVTHTTCATLDLYREIAHGFQIEARYRRSDLVRDIKDRIEKLARSQKVQPVLIVDEAHLLSRGALDDLRLLTSFEQDARDDLTLVLVGHPQLETNLRLAVNEALAQRIIVRARLRSLTADEVGAYLTFRLQCAGRHAKLFLDDAVEAITRASRGIPRVIDRIAEHAMLQAVQQKKAEIDADLVTDAIDEVQP